MRSQRQHGPAMAGGGSHGGSGLSLLLFVAVARMATYDPTSWTEVYADGTTGIPCHRFNPSPPPGCVQLSLAQGTAHEEMMLNDPKFRLGRDAGGGRSNSDGLKDFAGGKHCLAYGAKINTTQLIKENPSNLLKTVAQDVRFCKCDLCKVLAKGARVKYTVAYTAFNVKTATVTMSVANINVHTDATEENFADALESSDTKISAPQRRAVAEMSREHMKPLAQVKALSRSTGEPMKLTVKKIASMKGGVVTSGTSKLMGSASAAAKSNDYEQAYQWITLLQRGLIKGLDPQKLAVACAYMPELDSSFTSRNLGAHVVFHIIDVQVFDDIQRRGLGFIGSDALEGQIKEQVMKCVLWVSIAEAPKHPWPGCGAHDRGTTFAASFISSESMPVYVALKKANLRFLKCKNSKCKCIVAWRTVAIGNGGGIEGYRVHDLVLEYPLVPASWKLPIIIRASAADGHPSPIAADLVINAEIRANGTAHLFVTPTSDEQKKVNEPVWGRVVSCSFHRRCRDALTVRQCRDALAVSSATDLSSV